ncbi:NADH-dependent flavin oxidoreductase [Neisseria chenwenguii]|uniref:NADH-dependent flavin oxidoreductase n=1 Tax=Neisseria chenwenguii TaxID=1853278 RepID=A0A220S2I6_9NEIS|nr:NADH-dependent flavin oxidoreductase [Neisseria chenwenguii]ASK27689.1 NADH-dependent flavin oxidoreductase [Neisseria chenwenguii]ROV55693.1 NADH-dependent flavin oxidoreductase [Neisseria chenwenguii]
MTHEKYAPLFQPYTLNNGVEIKNRLVVAPMTHWASNEDGTLSDAERTFIGNRAQDFGMFIMAATLVSPEGKAFAGEPGAFAETQLAGLTEAANIIKKQGAKPVLQLHHGGYQAVDELIGGADKVAPSDVPPGVSSTGTPTTAARAMTEEEIANVIQAFGFATDLAIRAGFDGVEIHGANGYLLQQFVSGHFNRRSDQWGGSIENRLRFPMAVVDAVCAAKAKHARDDFIVGYRFSPEEPQEDGITMADTFALIDALKQKPLQYLHASLWDFYKKARRGADTVRSRLDLIHERLGGALPLIGVGNLFTADDALNALNTGWAEFLAFGKTVLINPNFATLIKEGREAEIQTEIDLDRPDRYGYSDYLWNLQPLGLDFLPPVKGKSADWKPLDAG